MVGVWFVWMEMVSRAAFRGGICPPPLEICCPPCRSAASLNLYLSIYTKGS